MIPKPLNVIVNHLFENVDLTILNESTKFRWKKGWFQISIKNPIMSGS